MEIAICSTRILTGNPSRPRAKDLFRKPPNQVFSVPVEMTMVGGEVLFDSRKGLCVSRD